MKSEMRQKLAQLPFEEKIRKVSELIRLSRKVKGSTEDALPFEQKIRMVGEHEGKRERSGR